MISIVVPTYNEEAYIHKLLHSISRQGVACEIIVADRSDDNTRSIARNYGCVIVDGGTPAEARNNGAAHASHDLLFLDADTILPDGFLNPFLKKAKKFDAASCMVQPIGTRKRDQLYYAIKNWANIIHPFPHTSGQCLFVKKETFNLVGGYATTLALGEEHDLVQRIVEQNKSFVLFRDIFVYNHPRRIHKEGFMTLFLKSLLSEIYRTFVGRQEHTFYSYDFGSFQQQQKGHYNNPKDYAKELKE